MKKNILLGIVLTAVMFLSMGCRLILEPDVDAVSRLFASLPTGDNRVVRELCDGEKACSNLTALGGVVRSEWYQPKKDFYTFEYVEQAKDTGYSYVHVQINLPASGSSRATTLPLVFEMERIKLRWHIYKVDGLDEFLRRAQRTRGIL